MMSDPSERPERLVEVLRELVALTGTLPVPKSDDESPRPALDAEKIRERDVPEGGEQLSA